MNKPMQNVRKGAAAGGVLGTAAMVALNAGHNKGKQMKKKAAKAMKTVGSVFDSISQMM